MADTRSTVHKVADLISCSIALVWPPDEVKHSTKYFRLLKMLWSLIKSGNVQVLDPRWWSQSTMNRNISVDLGQKLYVKILHFSPRYTCSLQSINRCSFKLLTNISERHCVSECSLAHVAKQQRQTLHRCRRRTGRKVQHSPVFILEITHVAHCC